MALWAESCKCIVGAKIYLVHSKHFLYNWLFTLIGKVFLKVNYVKIIFLYYLLSQFLMQTVPSNNISMYAFPIEWFEKTSKRNVVDTRLLNLEKICIFSIISTNYCRRNHIITTIVNTPVWAFIPSVWTLQFSYVITESFLIDASLWQAKEGGRLKLRISRLSLSTSSFQSSDILVISERKKKIHSILKKLRIGKLFQNLFV